MPKSTPQVSLLTPSGLQFYYPSFDGDVPTDASALTPTNPAIISDPRGGIYTLMAHQSISLGIGQSGSFFTTFDGIDNPSRPAYNPSAQVEHRMCLSEGVSHLPILPGNNPLWFTASGGPGSSLNLDDPEGYYLYPNIHGNNRVVSGSAAFTGASDAVAFEAGSTGRYALWVHAYVQAPNVAAVNATMTVAIDGVDVGTRQIFLNRANDRQTAVHLPIIVSTMQTGTRTISVRINGGALMGPFTAFLFYDPLGVASVFSGPVPLVGGTPWTFTPTHKMILFAALSAFNTGPPLGAFVGFHEIGGSNVARSLRRVAINPTNVHQQLAAIWSTVLDPGSISLGFAGQLETDPFPFTVDAGDWASALLLPIPYIG